MFFLAGDIHTRGDVWNHVEATHIERLQECEAGIQHHTFHEAERGQTFVRVFGLQKPFNKLDSLNQDGVFFPGIVELVGGQVQGLVDQIVERGMGVQLGKGKGISRTAQVWPGKHSGVLT